MKPQFLRSNKAQGFSSRAINKLIALIVAVAITMIAAPRPASAVGLIRDSETEELIRDYARPIMNAAGLASQNIQIHIIGSKSFNAFVVDGRNMFIHMGAIMQAQTPNQLIGVIAHEAGHIAGGHLSRLRAHAAKAQTLDLMLKILGGALLVAGAAGGGGKDLGKAGQGIFSSSSMHTMRSINRYRQSEEYAADQAAFNYLTRTRQSAKGMLETFEYFASQAIGSLKYSDPYVLSHPLPRQRINQLHDRARRSPYFNKKDSPALQLRHEMVRAKLVAFTSAPNFVFNRYPKPDSRPARYAIAIASFRAGGLKSFLPKINALIAEQPDNPYFYELKGQFLLEAGKAREAIPPLTRAVKLAPRQPLIRIMLAQAMSQINGQKNAAEIIRHLKIALSIEARSAIGNRLLANAYAQRRQIAEAELASARAYFYEGKLSLAKNQAARAKKKMKRGSPGWIQADDILTFRPPR